MIVELWPALFSCLFIAMRHVKLDLIAGLEELIEGFIAYHM